MELPKNITQVGEADRLCKIYIEDYVMSYLKQINRFAEDKDMAIALYGRTAREQEITYHFMYGAAKLDYIQREVRHLSQAQNQEIEKMRKKYFPESEFLGYVLLNGEMLEGVHVSSVNGCHYVKGYACFYEKNDSMLAYMLDNRLEEAKPEMVSNQKYEQEKLHREERRNEYIEQENERISMRGKNAREAAKGMNGMRFATASMFVLLCLISVVTFQTEGLLEGTVSKAKRLLGNRWGEENVQQETMDVMSDDVIGTLVAEEQLTEAIWQENQKTLIKEESTPLPTTIPTPEPTPDPTPEPTPEPTLAPTPVPVTKTENESSIAAMTQETSAQSQEAVKSYVIRPGDTLIGISTQYYGTDDYVEMICNLNKITNPDNVQIGQKILLP